MWRILSVLAASACAISLLAPIPPAGASGPPATDRGRVVATPLGVPASEPSPWNSNRDCGYSTRLDSVAQRWITVFCDTEAFTPTGASRGGGTASAATVNLSGSGTVTTRDPVWPFTPPGIVELIPPVETCAGGRSTSWPKSVVAIPDETTSTDLLAVFFQAYCVTGSGVSTQYERRSIGVAFLVYDPSQPNNPLRVDTSNPALFRYPLFAAPNIPPGGSSGGHLLDEGHGFGAVFEDRFLLIHQCWQERTDVRYSCHARRVILSGTNGLADIVRIGTASNYQDLRTSGSWGTGGTLRNILDPSGSNAGDQRYKANGGISITRIRSIGQYVMTYMDPDFNIVMRTADDLFTPNGQLRPWGPPVVIEAPCDGPGPDWPVSCYQPVVQDAMFNGSTGMVGFTYFDTGLSFPKLTASGTVPVYGSLRGASIHRSVLGI